MKSDWQLTQERQESDHKKGITVFSGEKQIGAMMTGTAIQQLIPHGKCLDIGCGILPLPGYMKVASSVSFTGIDPLTGGERKFTFFQCKAEELLFADQSFDAVLFATSIDHIEFPEKATAEAMRVLKHSGYIFVWGSFRNENDHKYITWKQTHSLKLYNHPWVFTVKSIAGIFRGAKLISTIDIQNSEKLLILQKCVS